MQVQGTVHSIRFRNETNGWTVFLLSTEDGALVCVGTLFSIMEGDRYALVGELVYHPKYGEQLRVEAATKIEESTPEQLVRYLSSDAVPHIGPKRAKRLVDKYGVSVIDVLLDEPEALLSIRGIGPAKAEAIRAALEKHRVLQSSMIFLQSLEIGPATAAEILNIYGADTEERINEDPYRLVEDVRGIGFITADAIARKLGVAVDSVFRARAGLLYLFARAARSEGASFLSAEELEEGIGRLLGGRPDSLDQALLELTLEGKLVRDLEKKRIALARMDEAERIAAARMVQLIRGEGQLDMGPLPLDLDEMMRAIGLPLDVEQQSAIGRAAAERVLVITGGPGTGKTTILRAVLHLFETNGLLTRLAAPTGRAAKRLEQATTREALTLHRLLGYRGGEEQSLGPSVDRDHPLEADCVIVDEVSMVDLDLFHHLMEGLATGTRLILVGDSDQLPSVGPGNVLHDLIASGVVPVVRLSRIYRQAEQSFIVQNAHRIRQGVEPILNEADGDFFFLPAPGPQDAADLIEDLVLRRLPEHYGFSPATDIQVLSPMKRGECGIEAMNERLQQSLNPPHPAKQETKVGTVLFREGDRVMQTKNDYDLPWVDQDETQGEGVYNGDFGILAHIDAEEDTLSVDFEGRIATYQLKQYRELAHSYAITVHKSQGSEFPCVVIAVVPGAPLLETRNILYTAMTRARQLCVLVGDRRTLTRMVENKMLRPRNSALDERLREAAE